MSKHERIAAFVESLDASREGEFHPCYAGYFECFNAGDYYEAHDVLEHLWLGCRDANFRYYKGLIQIAGAFVHLKKQHARPLHPTDGRRLFPAVRLFDLGISNISSFRPFHLGLDVDVVCAMCSDWRSRIEESAFRVNPWAPSTGPFIRLQSSKV